MIVPTLQYNKHIPYLIIMFKDMSVTYIYIMQVRKSVLIYSCVDEKVHADS